MGTKRYAPTTPGPPSVPEAKRTRSTAKMPQDDTDLDQVEVEQEIGETGLVTSPVPVTTSRAVPSDPFTNLVGNDAMVESENVSRSNRSDSLGPYLDDTNMNRDWGVEPALNRRLNTMLNWFDAKNATYCPTKFPQNGFWSLRFDGDSHEYFCDPRKRVPVTIWLVGRLAGAYLFRSDGEPERQASITVTLLDNAHLSACKSLLRTHTANTLHVPVDGYNTIRVSKWMNRRVAGAAAEVNEPFTAVYDAKILLQSKAKMTTIAPENLKRGDLVLVEAYLSRYRDRTMDSYLSPGRSGKHAARSPATPADAKWRASFGLKSICLLDDTEYVERGEDHTVQGDSDSDLAV